MGDEEKKNIRDLLLFVSRVVLFTRPSVREESQYALISLRKQHSSKGPFWSI